MAAGLERPTNDRDPRVRPVGAGRLSVHRIAPGTIAPDSIAPGIIVERWEALFAPLAR